MAKRKTPEVIEDKDLDETSAGIGLLLPAVQKVREAAITDGTSKTTTQTTTTGGINVALGDGSVRTL